MATNWKLTVVGGDENGMDFEFPGDRPVIIGRSHSVDLHLSEADVSGRHVELCFQDGSACQARNLSRYSSRLNGRAFPSGAVAKVSVGDVVELGRRVKIRIDGVPGVPVREVGDGETNATQWGGLADMPTAVMEESTVTSQGGMEAAGTQATRMPEMPTQATRVADETVVARIAAEAFESRTGEETVVGTGMPPPLTEEETQTGGDSGDGETRELETRVGSMEELLQRRQELDRRARFHKIVVGFGLLLVVAVLGGLWFASRTTKETYEMSYPKDASGRPDAASYILRDVNGGALIEVDYPRNPKAGVTVSPSSNGVTVVSYMGRERDVPFYLQIEAMPRADELRLDLMASVRNWLRRTEEAGTGFVFDERMKDEIKPRFFEDVFPDCCQSQSLYGLRFVMFEYKRTWPDGRLWHGILIYFRRGDTAYVHRREIPEFHWERGGYRLRQDPNIAIYTNFIESYWESPGLDGLPVDRPTTELMVRIRNVLSKERASDWRFLKKDLDAVLVKTWREDPKMRALAEGCLHQFRDVLKTYYYGKYNAFLNAKDNRDDRRMNRIRQDCQMVFDGQDERYYFLIGNAEVW